MKIAFQIDEISTLNSKTDSSLLIMHECKKRGFEVMFYHPQTLSFEDGEVFAKGFKFTGEQKSVGEQVKLKLDDFNYVFLRQDPPFDIFYITTTYLLEKLKKAKVLNNPNAVRSRPEKLFVLDFKEFIPETIITAEEEEVRSFLQKHGDIILKPLYSHGGMGVFYLSKTDKNLFNIFTLLKKNYNNLPVIAQKYIPNVTKGDKRILFINGEFCGAVNRVSMEGSVLSNTVRGGKPEKTELTEREKEICAAISPKLKELGLFLVGIDVIDGYITEINVTSPTCFAIYNHLYNAKIEEKIVDEMLKL